MSQSIEHPADAPILSVRLHPHRSLTRAQVQLLLCCVGLAGLVTTLPFLLLGAWPVVGFMGLDVLAVYFAFKASFRSARAYEDVELTAVELMVAKVSPKGLRAEWRFNPSWVRLQRKEHQDYGTVRIDLISRGRALEVASFLGPSQKSDFADALSQGLVKARAGVRFS